MNDRARHPAMEATASGPRRRGWSAGVAPRKRWLLACGGWYAALALAGAAFADTPISGLPAAGAQAGTEPIPEVQAATTKRVTPAQLATYNFSLVSGDATAASGGALTLSTVNSNVGSFGDATHVAAITVNGKGLVTAASATAITVPLAANPTATVGTSAVNGSAATFMRSDGAPAIDLTMSPTWTGSHTWSPAANATPITESGYSLTGSSAGSLVNLAGTLNTTGSPDVIKLAITDTARGASTKFLNLYGGAAGATSKFSVDNNGTVIVAASAGNGPSSCDWTIRNSSNAGIGGCNAGGGAGELVLFSNNAVVAAADDSGGPQINFIVSNVVRLGFSSSGAAAFHWDTGWYRRAAANVCQGCPDAAAPVAQTYSVQSVVAGTSNTSGANFTIAGSQGTGTGVGGDILFQTAPAGGSGTSQNALSTGFKISGKSAVPVLPGFTVATLPAAPPTGSEAYVTDAVACTFLAAPTGGGAVVCPVFYDGTSWKGA